MHVQYVLEDGGVQYVKQPLQQNLDLENMTNLATILEYIPVTIVKKTFTKSDYCKVHIEKFRIKWFIEYGNKTVCEVHM